MENGIFAKALHNFTMDAAAGDAIRHLADRGYSPSQIKDSLTFPAKDEYITAVMWDHFINMRMIVIPVDEKEPDTGIYELVEQRDRYGRKSFLRVKKESPEEMSFSAGDYILFDHQKVPESPGETADDFIKNLPWPSEPVLMHKSLYRSIFEK